MGLVGNSQDFSVMKISMTKVTKRFLYEFSEVT